MMEKDSIRGLDASFAMELFAVTRPAVSSRLELDVGADSMDRRRELGATVGPCVDAPHRFPAGPIIIAFAVTLRDTTRACVMAVKASAVEKSLRNTMGMDEMTQAEPCLLFGGDTGDAVGVGVGCTVGKLFFFVSKAGALVKKLFWVFTEGSSVIMIGD